MEWSRQVRIFAKKVLGKNQWREGSLPNFKTKALAVRKLKGKNMKADTEKGPILCTTFFCTENQCNFDLSTSQVNFFTRFLP